MSRRQPLLKCSFCGKSQKQVKKLIAGPGVYICNECIDLCNEIIEEDLEGAEERSVPDRRSSGHPAGSNRFVLSWKLGIQPIAEDDGVTPHQTYPSIEFLAHREQGEAPDWVRFDFTWKEMDQFSSALAGLLSRIDRSSGELFE